MERRRQTLSVIQTLIAAIGLSLLSFLWTDDLGYSRKISVLSALWLSMCLVQVGAYRIRILEEKALGDTIDIQKVRRDSLFLILSILFSCLGARFFSLDYWHAYLIAFLLPMAPGLYYLTKRFRAIR